MQFLSMWSPACAAMIDFTLVLTRSTLSLSPASRASRSQSKNDSSARREDRGASVTAVSNFAELTKASALGACT